MAFTTLVVANLALILSNRSLTRTIFATIRRSNPAMWWIIGGTLSALALTNFVPFLRDLFQFGQLHADDLLLTLAAGLASIFWFELFKLVRRWRRVRAGG